MVTPDKRDMQKIKRAKILPKGKITTQIFCFGDGSDYKRTVNVAVLIIKKKKKSTLFI